MEEEGDETCRQSRRSWLNLNKNEAWRSIARVALLGRPGGVSASLLCTVFSPFLVFVTVCVCFRAAVLFREELFDGRLPMDE